MEKTVIKGSLIWITGLSGAGKTTIGKALYQRIKAQHSNTLFLDGDVFREILGNDLSHTPEDRLANAMRIARMCRFLVEQEMIVICATMSLFKEVHAYNRAHIQPYYEIFIEVPISELIRRDQKKIYSQAVAGKIANVVGVDLPYDRPEACDLILENQAPDQVEAKVDRILTILPPPLNRL